MGLLEWIDRDRGGIAHTHDALRMGYSTYAIRSAVTAGNVVRVRRSWLATDRAPKLLRDAAEAGGRLACVTAAVHHGLWTLDDGRPHLSVPGHAGHARPGQALVHWSVGPVEAHRYELVEPVVNALWQIADCRPFEEAFATWESAIRSSRVALESLERIPTRSTMARRILGACSQLSDSGIESIPVARLRRIGIAVRQQIVIDGHSVDVLIGDRLVLQVDGYEFHRSPAQRRADIAHDRRLRLMGYTVLRVDYQQVLFGWETVEAEIRTALAQGLHHR